MALVSRWGVGISGSEPETLRAYEDFAARLLRLDNGVEAIVSAAEMHPESISVQLGAATFYLYGQTRETMAAAARHLDLAEGLLSAANEREWALSLALRLLWKGEYQRSLTQLREMNVRWPEDLLTAKIAEFLYYLLGQQHTGPLYRAHLAGMADHFSNDPDFLGMASFASELCDDLTEAERLAERALEIEPRNPWAQHSLSHVLIRRGQASEGVRRMQEFLPVLEGCGRPIYCHDAWHLGLLYLEELDYENAEAVLHQHVWSTDRDGVGILLDTIALGWRMEMGGHSLNDFWTEVADHVEPRVGECFVPFLNAHWAFALARAGRSEALGKLLAAVNERAAQTDEEARRVWAPSGAPIVEACAHFGAGDAASALKFLEPAMPGMMQIGGSDAQDDLFRQTFFSALARTGRKAEAAAYLNRVLGNKKRSPLDEYFNALIV